MISIADATTGGFIVGNIVAGVTAVICIIVFVCAASIALRKRGRHYPNGPVPATITAVCSVLALLATFGVWLWASWPLAYEYHHWVDKTVTVTDVNKRIVSHGDNGISQKFVVVDPSGAYYGIEDTRAALIMKDDVVKLRCKKSYQFGVSRSAHGWDCRWAG